MIGIPICCASFKGCDKLLIPIAKIIVGGEKRRLVNWCVRDNENPESFSVKDSKLESK
jgi:hypothetical protein